MVSPIDIQKALSGMDYPANKEQILQKAEENDAGEQVLQALQKIPDREYDGPSGVSKEAFN